MNELRARLKEYERAKKVRVICPTSSYKCIYCPRSYTNCKKLIHFLDTGEWD